MNIFPFYYLMDTQSVFREGTTVAVFIKIYKSLYNYDSYHFLMLNLIC